MCGCFESRKFLNSTCSFIFTFLTILSIGAGLLVDDNLYQGIDLPDYVHCSSESKNCIRTIIDSQKDAPKKINYGWSVITVERWENNTQILQRKAVTEGSLSREQPIEDKKVMNRLPDDLDHLSYTTILEQDECVSFCNTIANLKSAGTISRYLFCGVCLLSTVAAFCLFISSRNFFQQFVRKRLERSPGFFLGDRRLAVVFCFVSWLFSFIGILIWLILLDMEGSHIKKFACSVYSGLDLDFGYTAPGLSLFAFFGGSMFNAVALLTICCFPAIEPQHLTSSELIPDDSDGRWSSIFQMPYRTDTTLIPSDYQRRKRWSI